MSHQSAFWNKIEKFKGNKYPKFIKEILNLCGYDNEYSIGLLNDKTILEIEQRVNCNKSVLKKTVYDEKENFQFLIGHKALL